MVGLFGGTFDPVHEGHLLLAHEAVRRYSFRRLYLVPAWQNPLKTSGPSASAADRLEMLRLAVQASPDSRIGILDWEANSATPSYTYPTLKRLLQTEKDPVALLMGNEVFQDVPLWHEASQLVQNADFIVVMREEAIGFDPKSVLARAGVSDLFPDPKKKNRFLYAGSKHWVERLDMKVLPVCATEIRETLAQHWKQGELQSAPQGIQRSVWQYIKEKRLYTVSN